MSCFADFAEICQADAPLRDYTWYRLGGPARWLLSPRDEAELAAVLARCRKHDVPWRVLGRGANVLVRDEGIDGAVIRLTGAAWEILCWEGATVYAGAGADFPPLVKQSVERGLLGLESLAGIPGTVGGIIRMNAGGKYGQIADCTRDVRVCDETGRITTRSAAEVGFGYRRTNLAGCVVLGATFTLRQGERAAAIQRFQEIWEEKSATQAAVSQRSAGCIFKNPPGEHAGRLLDAQKLKGVRVGGAEISRQHANFIVAHEGATARNVLDLITLARDRVRESEGIELELEVEIW